MVDYNVVNKDNVSIKDLSENKEIPPDLDIRPIDSTLHTEELAVKIWYFEPGEEIQYHAHSEQEELYYVLEGDFSLKLGASGEEEYVDASPGTFWVAGPKTGHGHRYVGDDRGVVLAVGAPNVEDPGLDPHSLDEE